MPVLVSIMPINRFRGEFFYLSNFYTCRHAVEFDGDAYPTSEHAYQAAKIEERSGRDSFTCGGSLGDNPMDAKRKGGKVKKRPNWDSIKVDIMLTVVRSKFARDRALQKKLIATKGQTIIEGHTNDDFWGGKRNHLGRILMRVRDELAVAEKHPVPADYTRADDDSSTPSSKPAQRCKGRVDRRAAFEAAMDTWMDNAELVLPVDVDAAASPIDEVGQPVAPVTALAAEVDFCSSCTLAATTAPQWDKDRLAVGQAALPSGFAAWLWSALVLELADTDAEGAFCAMEVILGEPGDDPSEALALAAEALQGHGASKVAEEVQFRWLLEGGACAAGQDEQAGGHSGPASMDAARAPEVMDSPQRTSDIPIVQDAKPVGGYTTDAHLVGQQAALEVSERRRRPRGGRSGFRRKYDADHV